VALLGGCKEENHWENGIPPSGMYNKPQNIDSTDYARILDRVLLLQDSVTAFPGDYDLALRLKQSAWDTSCGCFFSVGKGVANPTHPKETWTASRKTAARYSARRWSLYLKAWHLEQHIAFGAPISGEIVYSKGVYDTLVNDTLYHLIKVPVGSIVLK
jgi:hypothetical protein